MVSYSWLELPATVRAAVEVRTGPVLRAVDPGAGRNSDFAGLLRAASGAVFLKAVKSDGARHRAHRHEAVVNPQLPATVAPRLRWHAEVDGWLLLAFDSVPGEHADLAPGSPDLPAVAGLVRALGAIPGAAPSLAEQWARLSPWRRLSQVREVDPDLIALEREAHVAAEGDRLVHTDLHGLNVLVDGGSAKAVDWAWSRRGNPAVDVAFLVVRLVMAGHRPEAAAAWADAIPCWADAAPRTRAALVVEIWGIWEHLDRPIAAWTAAARASAEHLVSRTGL